MAARSAAAAESKSADAAVASITKGRAGEPSTEDLKAQVDRLREDVSELGALLRGMAESKASHAKDEVEARVADARAAAEAQLSAAQAKARGVEDDAVAFVRDKPMQSLAIAAGLGLVAGMLTRPR